MDFDWLNTASTDQFLGTVEIDSTNLKQISSKTK